MLENPVVFLIPIISALIGYGTNWLAIKMMFHPTEFVGIKPFLGWQGLIPLNADRVAAHTTRLITSRLLNLKMLFEDFDAAEFMSHMQGVLDEITDEILKEATEKYAAAMWSAMAPEVQQQIRDALRAEIEKASLNILQRFADDIESIIDVENVIVQVVREDRRLFSELFMRVGGEEFKFIERSGLTFGFLFGVIQMIIWVLFPKWWILPFAGFLVGYATNYAALRLIFEPAEPVQYGPFRFQGLFHKRKEAVSNMFADMVSEHFLSPANIVRISSQGETADKILGIVESEINTVLDTYSKHPMAPMVTANLDMDEVHKEIHERIGQEIGRPGGFLETFAANSVDVFEELFTRMRALPPEEFESLLRTPLKQDEWKLIVIGGLLGAGAGWAQLVYLFGEMLLASQLK